MILEQCGAVNIERLVQAARVGIREEDVSRSHLLQALAASLNKSNNNLRILLQDEEVWDPITRIQYGGFHGTLTEWNEFLSSLARAVGWVSRYELAPRPPQGSRPTPTWVRSNFQTDDPLTCLFWELQIVGCLPHEFLSAFAYRALDVAYLLEDRGELGLSSRLLDLSSAASTARIVESHLLLLEQQMDQDPELGGA